MKSVVLKSTYIMLCISLSVVALLVACYFVAHMPFWRGRAGIFDWYIFVDSAKHYINTGQLYAQNLVLYGPGAAIYKFPPLFVSIVVFCFQHGVSPASLWFWNSMLHIVLYFITAAILLLGIKRNNPFLLYPIVAIFLFSSEAFLDNFVRLQLEIYVVFLVSLGIFFLVQKRFIASGFCLGFSAGLKLYPAFFCIGFLIRRDYRTWIGVLVGFGATLAISLITISSGEHWHYFTRIVPHMFAENISRISENISISYFLLSLGFPAWFAGFIAKMCLILAAVIVVAGVVFVEYRRESLYKKEEIADALRIASGFSVLISAFVVGTQNSWWNYQLLLMIPVITTMITLLDKRYFNWIALVAIFSGILLIYCGSVRHVAVMMSLNNSLFANPVYLRAIASMLIYLASVCTYWTILKQQR